MGQGIWAKDFEKPAKIGFGVALLAGSITFFLPNYYRSDARILPVEAKGAGGLGSIAAAAAAFGVNVPGADGADANYVDMLKSRTIREELVNAHFHFNQLTWRFGSNQSWDGDLHKYLDAKNMDGYVTEISKLITFTRDPKSKIILISAETRSPELSQQLVQTATKLLENFIQEKGRTRGGTKVLFTEARLKESRDTLAQASEDLRRFLDANRNFRTSTDSSIQLKGVALETEFKLQQQLVMTLALQREQAMLDEKNDMPILNVLDAGSLPLDPNSPKRKIIIIEVFILSLAGAWSWFHRAWIRERLVETGVPSVPGLRSNEEGE